MKPATRFRAIRWPIATAAAVLSVSAVVIALHRAPVRDNGPALASQNPNPGADTQGPVRMARFSNNVGAVMFRPSSTNLWATATINQPLRQGASIYLQRGADSEVQFDDGAAMRLGYQAAVTLQTMYSDSQGEFTELRLTTGAMTLHLRHGNSIYQVDTPFASVRADGPADFRVGVGAALTVSDYAGRAQVQSSGGNRWVDAGQSVRLGGAGAAISLQSRPRSDSFDHWCRHRDTVLYGDPTSERVLPSDIALVCGNLTDYGNWYHDPNYGSVWRPIEPIGWRPYHSGRWVWVAPVGWTWVATEPWGWAPYHYGSWAYEEGAWEWIPGPVYQYWSPAVVSLSYYSGGYAWCPLGPSEVRYPAAFSIGFSSGNWAVDFSIGGAGNYYPYGGGAYYTGDPWNTGYVNRVTNISITNIYNSRAVAGAWYNGGVYQGGSVPTAGFNSAYNGRFIPQNARFAAGATFASAAAFGGRGVYRGLNAGNVAPFSQGRIIGAPRAGFQPVSGPRGGATLASFSASRRTFASSRPSMVLSRGVYRAALPSSVAALSSHRYAGSIRTLPARVAFGRAPGRIVGRTGRTPGFAGTARSPGMPAFGRNARPMGFGARRAAPGHPGVPANVAAARRSMGFGGNRGRAPASHAFGRFARPAPGSHAGNRPGVGRRANPAGFGARRAPAAVGAARRTFAGGRRPQYRAPSRPQYRRPSQPRYRAPSRPQYRPQYRRPSRPQYRPQYRRPSRPQYRPSRPQYRAPSRPQFRPSRPQYRAPSRPQYRPSRPQYRAPSRPQYRPPSRPQKHR
ncbi:MAG: FecR domain-containing protein [Armatimonadetes bacterium]|nr:FecR domain-containing protein [Armatimonadota bacterium]MDE2206293.1 FecR domain-containing protein [Armatimonadota bacterium]